MWNIQESVKNFYNAQAEKFSGTRKKTWPEFFYIKEQVDKLLRTNEKIKILELGCGDGRLYRYLLEYFSQDRIEYIWVDISEWLINIAKNETNKSLKSLNWVWTWNKSSKFYVSDMLWFLEKQDQQDFDMVVAVASFQHIPTKWERLLIMKNIYRVLNYDAIVIMFNWSFSKWFFKKYAKSILKSLLVWVLSLWTKAINDIYVPWKDNKTQKIYYRYYHIFFLYELKYLFKQSWFIIQESCYINKNWEKSISRIDSRNSMLLWKKTVLK